MLKKRIENVPWGNSAGLLDTVGSPAVFAGWLIKPRLHETLPVLVKVPIRDHIIPLAHLEAVSGEKKAKPEYE